jgi:GNAT superfamily N-acetyltransferase
MAAADVAAPDMGGPDMGGPDMGGPDMGGVQVRPMRESDIEAVSAVRVNGWKAAYAGLVPASYLDRMNVADDARKRREWFGRSDGHAENLVAESGGEIVGWAALGPSRDDDRREGDGELRAIYLQPAVIGTGVGKALMVRALAWMGEQGFDRVTLWVLDGNARARRFYEGFGFAPDGSSLLWHVEDVELPELRYCRELTHL